MKIWNDYYYWKGSLGQKKRSRSRCVEESLKIFKIILHKQFMVVSNMLELKKKTYRNFFPYSVVVKIISLHCHYNYSQFNLVCTPQELKIHFMFLKNLNCNILKIKDRELFQKSSIFSYFFLLYWIDNQDSRKLKHIS